MPLKTFQDEQPVLNLTPMIDVLFLLIIFFMVGTKFAGNEKKIPLMLPSVGTAATLTAVPKTRRVHVLQDGSVKLDATDVTLPQLTESLKESRKQHPGLSVTIRGDARGAFQHVASTMAACRAAGVRDMAISVVPATEQTANAPGATTHGDASVRR